MTENTPYRTRVEYDEDGNLRKYCEWCGEYLDPEWAEPKTKFCSRKCLNAEWYSRHKSLHKKKYAKEKREWERSPVGKKAGIQWRHWWIYVPDFFK